MRRNAGFLIIIGLIVFCPTLIFSATIHVPTDQPTIQAGINGAIGGDTVLVAEGVYTGDGNQDIDFAGKNIVLKSENGPDVTVIDCSATGVRGFYLHSNEDTTSIIDGFKIANANLNRPDNGGGIWLENSSPKIQNCIFKNNTVFASTSNSGGGNGAAIWANYSSLIILGCKFEDNESEMIYSTDGGGAISLNQSLNPIIKNCIFINNRSKEKGGAINCDNSDAMEVDNCSFFENYGGHGGCISLSASSPPASITNCIFADNVAAEGSVFFMGNTSPQIINCTIAFNMSNCCDGSAIDCHHSSPQIINCIIAFNDDLTGGPVIYTNQSDPNLSCTNIFGNTGGDWVGDFADQFGINGNISLDPLFCDTANGDFTIKDISPCAPGNNSCSLLIGALGVGCANSAPSIPVPLSPINDEIVNTDQPTLWIQNSTDAEGDTLTYDFIVCYDTTFGEPDPLYEYNCTEETDSTGWQVTEPLNENWKYWWRARAFDQYEYSDWAEGETFWINTTEEPPFDFQIQYPPDTSGWYVFNMLTPFMWEQTADPDPNDSAYYTLYIAIDSDFIFVSKIDSIWQAWHNLTDSLEFGTQYWWKVKATDNTGLATYSSNTLDFKTWKLGDANGDWKVDIFDVTFLISYLYLGGQSPYAASGDINGDCIVNIFDVTYLIVYVYMAGPAPQVGCD